MKLYFLGYFSLIFFSLIFLVSAAKTKKDDLYKVLEVNKTATILEIRKAFKRLALKYHPDKNKVKKEWAQEMFTKIAGAYEILSNPEKRRSYDFGGMEEVEDLEEEKVHLTGLFLVIVIGLVRFLFGNPNQEK